MFVQLTNVDGQMFIINTDQIEIILKEKDKTYTIITAHSDKFIDETEFKKLKKALGLVPAPTSNAQLDQYNQLINQFNRKK